MRHPQRSLRTVAGTGIAGPAATLALLLGAGCFAAAAARATTPTGTSATASRQARTSMDQGADAPRPGAQAQLVVCADPNNLPFSNRAGQGFENKLAQLLANELHARLSYLWWAQRRGYVRHTLNEERCDIWPGVAAGIEQVATTRPYYGSTYVFVTRADRPLAGLSLDDTRLRSLSIGVQMVGDNATNTPPAHALARRGLTRNVHGYMLYGNYKRPNPPAAIIGAVADGEIDVALAWGPMAGYFAQRAAVPLRIEPIAATPADEVPMSYEICVGVRREDPALREQIQRVLDRNQDAIAQLLRQYHVPTISTDPLTALGKEDSR